MATATAITGIQLLTDAYRIINVTREGQTPSNNQLQQGVRTLNEMMAAWEADGIALRYVPIGTPSSVLNLPDGAIMGVKYNVAIALVPYVGGTATPETVLAAAQGMAIIHKITAVEPKIQSDLPVPSDWQVSGNIRTGGF